MKTEFFPVPIEGQLLSINEVPDEVFSKKVLGDGFAIKFTGEKLLSPFDGTVIATFPTGHSVIIRRDDGLEVLMHVGLSSAKLTQAFVCHVKKYQKISKGQLLIEVKNEYFDDKTNFCPIVFSTPEIKVELLNKGKTVKIFDETSIKVTF